MISRSFPLLFSFGCSGLSVSGHYELIEATEGGLAIAYPVTVASEDEAVTTSVLLTLGKNGGDRHGELVTLYTYISDDEVVEEAWYQEVDVMKVGKGYHLFAQPNDEADPDTDPAFPWAADCAFKKKVLTCVDDFADISLFTKI